MVDFSVQEVRSAQVSRKPVATRLSQNISARRRELGLTQAQLAERLGVDTETLSRFERGKHVPSLLTLERLAVLLLVTVADLLAEEPKKAEQDALIITSWLSGLNAEDKAFATSLLKQCCDYFSSRPQSESSKVTMKSRR
jgi:transcriptional regulator with XRE-family HTH domain